VPASCEAQPMRVRIQDIPEEGRRVDEVLDRAWLDGALDGAGRAVEPGASVSLLVERVGAKVLVRGTVKAAAKFECARCLGGIQRDLSFDLTHVLEPRPEPDRLGEDLELTEEDLDVSFFDGPEVDLEEVLREHLLLALPMRALCRDDCAGLCGRCGANLNQGVCECPPEVDPRWAALQQLKI
jgi:uncharacterized protein